MKEQALNVTERISPEKLYSGEVFEPFINKVSVIIIAPNGEPYILNDNGEDNYNDVFSKIPNRVIKGIVMDLHYGVLKAQALSQKGYIVMIGNSPSAKKNRRDYNNKHLFLPQEELNDAQNLAFENLLSKFDFCGIDTKDIPVGLSLTIHIGNTKTETINLKSNNDRAKKKLILKTIKETRLQIEQGKDR